MSGSEAWRNGEDGRVCLGGVGGSRQVECFYAGVRCMNSDLRMCSGEAWSGRDEGVEAVCPVCADCLPCTMKRQSGQWGRMDSRHLCAFTAIRFLRDRVSRPWTNGLRSMSNATLADCD
jgi:hypothetical protein